MRHLLVVTATGLLLASGAAFAQSGYVAPVQPQGPAHPNYLGSHPSDGATSSGSSGVIGGTGQGGYLGTQPGENPARTHQVVPPVAPPVQPH